MTETIETPVKLSFLTRAMLAAEAKKAEIRAAKADETNNENPAPNKRKIVKVTVGLGALAAAAYATYRLLNANAEENSTESDEIVDTDTSIQE